MWLTFFGRVFHCRMTKSAVRNPKLSDILLPLMWSHRQIWYIHSTFQGPWLWELSTNSGGFGIYWQRYLSDVLWGWCCHRSGCRDLDLQILCDSWNRHWPYDSITISKVHPERGIWTTLILTEIPMYLSLSRGLKISVNGCIQCTVEHYFFSFCNIIIIIKFSFIRTSLCHRRRGELQNQCLVSIK